MQHSHIFYRYSSLTFRKIAQLYILPNHLKKVILQISSPLRNRNKSTPNILQKIKSKEIKLKRKNEACSGTGITLITRPTAHRFTTYLIEFIYHKYYAKHNNRLPKPTYKNWFFVFFVFFHSAHDIMTGKIFAPIENLKVLLNKRIF